MSLRVQIFQHVPFEGPGSIASWCRARHALVRTTLLYENPPLPGGDDFDFLVLMGGPMSVNDEDAFPWLRGEKDLVRKAVHSGKPVLGICLGAQLIAAALGARVYPGPEREIGWFPVRAAADPDGVFDFPPEVNVFHWHGETFDLPPGAVRLAESAVCRHQAFRIGDRVLGLQFHLETTPESAQALITHCADEFSPGPFVQDEQTLRAVPPQNYAEVNALMARLLTRLTDGIASPEESP